MITLIDFARVAISICAVFAMLLMARRAHRARIQNHDEFALYATSALLVVMALTVISQLQHFGQKLATPYGLPMLGAATVLTLIALAKSKV